MQDIDEPKYHPALAVLLAVFGIVIIGVGILAFVPNLFDPIKMYIKSYPVLGPIVYILVVTLTIVVAPLHTAPIVPLGAGIWGVPLMTFYIMMGWLLGATLAFLIARYLGRPVLKHFVSVKKIDEYEKYIPEDAEFMAILLLRIAIPFDFMNYAIGLFSRIRFEKYITATAVGFLPYAYLSSIAGSALVGGNIVLGVTIFLAVMSFVALFSKFVLKKKKG
jgi:uncharacterized membrane protein YdjX (TVP38/TMEM64 family)